MKYVKMLGVTAVAAMALMAFLGVGTASATVLCSTTPEWEDICPSSWDYWAGTSVYISQESSALIETTGGTVLDTCPLATIKGKTLNSGSSTDTVRIQVDELMWERCTKTTDSIKNQDTTYGYLEIHRIAGTHNGTITGKNQKITINTIFGSCTYGTPETGADLGVLTQSNFFSESATVDLEAIITLIEGGKLCPKEARWTGNYAITSPQPMYIGAG